MSIAQQFFKVTAPLVSNLAARWADEHEYENIEDYLIPLKPIALEHGITLLRIQKRPFAIRFKAEGTEHTMTVSRTKITLTSKEPITMTVKNATKLASTLTKGLTNSQIDALTELNHLTPAEREQVINAYRQLPTEPDDLLGTPTTEPKPKASKPVAKASKPAAKASKPVAKKAAGPRPVKMGTTAILFRELIKGRTPEQALAAALKAFPKAPTNLNSAAWCKSQLACKTAYAARYIKEFGK